ncbi:CG14275 [Drosophila busckii]|uniref:CG14275 n=1 Tax=Drosophila busckii TaxID=30019 RepID=A0A0M4E4Q1_DROBS|nr:uncharacterized protein LOC108600776 [Drosophila busckii]ALC38908.1 CG14275 [Drosophila busckii]
MSTMLAYVVLIAALANVLSVDAIRCHQCNSHENPDCGSLLVNTPRAQRDKQYLRECAPKGNSEVFCRKTVIELNVQKEHRIERSCGWIKEKTHNACFTADNEGYKQTICTCSDDSCNGANLINSNTLWATTFALCVALSNMLRS